ncbi:hypothetical protein SLEP1_g45715 [Rubroshorea leprosula]|uniref:Peptidase A1 domain-containing protein n=1 Tax=Rubroshorea leprosula TaxID=152421 RepID=A0AAV5LK76_9ROSI|nr:hypothetical protein SLEP1_g45715 [Rubroshorea leprosula]
MDANKSRKLSLMLVLLFQLPDDYGFGSSLVFPVTGNVHPLGYFAVSLSIGNQPRPFTLDIDTGSDLTWVPCDIACTGCTVPPGPRYKPVQGSIVYYEDPICSAIQGFTETTNGRTDRLCHFDRSYVDGSSVRGLLVRDIFYGRITGGTLPPSSLTFGCVYDIHRGQHSPSPTGVLALGNGAANICSQLGVENVIGHCYSSKGGGSMFIGNDAVPSSGVSWVPMSQNTGDKYYESGPADLLFNGNPTGQTDLYVIFDSGSTYTYFNSAVYAAIIDQLSKDPNGKPITQVPDPALPVCWEHAELSGVHFESFTLSFTGTRNAQLQLTLENYPTISENGNACLGILNGTEEGLQERNVIGDISMLDKLVIYDNEKKQIGWASANCNQQIGWTSANCNEQIGWTSANCNTCCSLNIFFHLQLMLLLCLLHNIK